jgi:hypothetical protein
MPMQLKDKVMIVTGATSGIRVHEPP